MDRIEREKLKSLCDWLEHRIHRRDHPWRHWGKRALMAGLTVGGLIVAAKARKSRGISGQSAQALGAAVAAALPSTVLSDLLKSDPDAVIPEEDSPVILEYVRECFARGPGARNQILVRGNTVVLWYHGRCAYLGNFATAGRYLQEFLAHPRRRIDPTELVKYYGKTQRADPPPERESDLEAAAEAYGAELARSGREGTRGARRKGPSGPDEEAKKVARANLEEVKRKLSGVKDGDEETRSELNEEKRTWESFLRESDTPTWSLADRKRDATNLRNLLKGRLVKSVRDQLPDLADHLSNSLRIEAAGCMYDPSPEEDWLCG